MTRVRKQHRFQASQNLLLQLSFFKLSYLSILSLKQVAVSWRLWETDINKIQTNAAAEINTWLRKHNSSWNKETLCWQNMQMGV